MDPAYRFQGLPGVDPAEVREQLEAEELRSQVNTGQGFSLLILSLFLFVGAQATFGAMADFIAALVIVLLVHELGHYAAMKAFGYRDTQMFFIPFLGAAVKGRHDDASGTQRAVVALAGPLPGIVLGVLAVWMIGPMSAFMATLVSTAIVLNFFNLLPILPFDGGHFAHIVWVSRWPSAEFLVRLLMSAALAWIGYRLHSWVLTGFGVLMVLGAGHAARMRELSHELRLAEPALPTSILARPELIAPLAARLQQRVSPERVMSPRRMAMLMQKVWQGAREAPPGPLASVALSAVYLLFVGFGVFMYLRGNR
jgi:Zn-dependent protease